MTKVTLNDIEYDTEDFNEDQLQILNQLSRNENVIQSLKCQLNGVSVVSEILIKRLKDSLDVDTTDDN
tara:strand:+ start:3585 stop:3788 length:204 start_codon:yes stop_codon:yes gene_type:complete